MAKTKTVEELQLIINDLQKANKKAEAEKTKLITEVTLSKSKVEKLSLKIEELKDDLIKEKSKNSEVFQSDVFLMDVDKFSDETDLTNKFNIDDKVYYKSKYQNMNFIVTAMTGYTFSGILLYRIICPEQNVTENYVPETFLEKINY